MLWVILFTFILPLFLVMPLKEPLLLIYFSNYENCSNNFEEIYRIRDIRSDKYTEIDVIYRKTCFLTIGMSSFSTDEDKGL